MSVVVKWLGVTLRRGMMILSRLSLPLGCPLPGFVSGRGMGLFLSSSPAHVASCPLSFDLAQSHYQWLSSNIQRPATTRPAHPHGATTICSRQRTQIEDTLNTFESNVNHCWTCEGVLRIYLVALLEQHTTLAPVIVSTKLQVERTCERKDSSRSGQYLSELIEMSFTRSCPFLMQDLHIRRLFQARR